MTLEQVNQSATNCPDPSVLDMKLRELTFALAGGAAGRWWRLFLVGLNQAAAYTAAP